MGLPTKSRRRLINETLLRVDRNGSPPSMQAKVAVAALFWEVAQADGEFHRCEHEEILYRLDREFGLVSGEACELLEIVQSLEPRHIHMDKHLGLLNQELSPLQREHLFQVLMEIASVDETIEQVESELALEWREKLNLPNQG